MGPGTDTDMVRGIITDRITDILPTIIVRTALTITVHTAIHATEITTENGTIGGGIIQGTATGVTGITEITSVTDVTATSTIRGGPTPFAQKKSGPEGPPCNLVSA